MAFIDFEDVHKSFGDLVVLNGCDLKIERGESVVIIGGSGTGKSVVLKHLMGLLYPDKGRVLFDGMNFAEMPERETYQHRIRMSMLFQGAALFDSLSVKDNIAFALREHKDYTEEKIDEIVAERLRMVGMPGIEEKFPAELSGGMKKRVGLARAIAMDPEVILYDEPTTGLDPIMADVINYLIIKMHKEIKTTSIAVTHDMNSAYKIATRIVMLYKGKIIEGGTPEQVQNTDNPILRQFVLGQAEGPITEGMKFE